MFRFAYESALSTQTKTKKPIGCANRFSFAENDFYEPYPVKFSDIAEIWEYAGSLERGIFKPAKNEVQPLESVIRKIQQDILEIREKVS